MGPLNLDKAISKAKSLGLNYQSLKPSQRKGKRFSIIHNNKIIHFGAYPYAIGTYLDHGNDEIKKRWQSRHSKIMKDGMPAYKNKDSPEYYSWHILW